MAQSKEGYRSDAARKQEREVREGERVDDSKCNYLRLDVYVKAENGPSFGFPALCAMDRT